MWSERALDAAVRDARDSVYIERLARYVNTRRCFIDVVLNTGERLQSETFPTASFADGLFRRLLACTMVESVALLAQETGEVFREEESHTAAMAGRRWVALPTGEG